MSIWLFQIVNVLTLYTIIILKKRLIHIVVLLPIYGRFSYLQMKQNLTHIKKKNFAKINSKKTNDYISIFSKSSFLLSTILVENNYFFSYIVWRTFSALLFILNRVARDNYNNTSNIGVLDKYLKQKKNL